MDKCMTAEDILNGYRLLLHEETDLRHAFDLAIEALGEPTISEKESVDCISRADTIKAMCRECKVFPDDVVNCADCTEVAIVKGMPTCNQTCNTCNQKQVTSKLESAEIATLEGEESTMNQPKSKLDCISRQDAIEALTGWETEPLDEDIVRRLKSLPQVVPDFKTFCGMPIKEAIEVLEKYKHSPSVTPIVSEDCISRQQAVEEIALHDCTNGEVPYFTGKGVQEILNNLPPVTPTVSEDCISRAEALDEFKKDYDDVFDLMTAIEELPSVTPTERTEWIPVSERLPEYMVDMWDEGVIATVNGREGNIIYENGIVPDAWFEDGKWYVNDVELENAKVVAWQPQPDPYKGGDTE